MAETMAQMMGEPVTQTIAERVAEVIASQPSPVFDNSTLWHNFTLWTAQRLGYAVNISRLTPSIEDLVRAGPRMVMKLGRLGGSFISFDAVDNFGQRVIPESTDPGIFHTTVGAAGALLAETTPAALPSIAAEQDPNAFATRFSMEGARGLGSVFSYATSRWALCCIAMAVIINRTLIFAATRRRFRLGWKPRLAIRIVPIILLFIQGRHLLGSIQCQTSPDFAELRWGNASKSSDLMFSHSNTFLHGLSQTLLIGATDEESCVAVQMVPSDPNGSAINLRGSLSRLWPLFGTFCMSQFVEVISCAVQGRPIAAETGMTLFEHSLAFAEADAAVSNQLGWGLFANGTTVTGQTSLGSNIAITRSMIMKRVNTPPEVLLIAFLSTMGHLTSHILGVLNLQSKVRLVSTGIYALCFMGSLVWSGLTFSLEDTASQSVLRYPTVCIVGFIPHVLVFSGIIACGFIYLLALLLCASATAEIPGEGRQPTFRERLAAAHGNMQANVSLSDIRIRMDMDFYTALLRAGFAAITMASEAVYLNEDRRVNLKRYTWLEDERFVEREELRMRWVASGIPGSRFDSVGTIGLVPVQVQDGATSGYAREKVAQQLDKSTSGSGTGNRRIRDGVGAAERSSRWLMALEYMMHVNRLIITAWAVATSKFLGLVGVRNQPRVLRWLAQRPKKAEVPDPNKRPVRQDRSGTEWLASPTIDGGPIPRVDRVDVEAEVRAWLDSGKENRRTASGRPSEGEIDTILYRWWLKGGWWGSRDSSDDYLPPPTFRDDNGHTDPDFDATSVISSTETTVSSFDGEEESGWESDGAGGYLDGDLDGGQRTPTQRFPGQTPNPFASREGTPLVDTPLDPADLSRLLHPTSPEERDEARTLAAHLGSDRVVTRSAYRRLQQRQRAQILVPARTMPRPDVLSKMTAEEEASTLEQIILSRRAAADPVSPRAVGGEQQTHTGSWATGAAGLGADGPQCVVCQSAPRTVIVWPCRCLSLCDDCRVSLAMNNFDKCVCCRREVISFSRIYVP